MTHKDKIVYVALLFGAMSGYGMEAALLGWKEILQPIHVFSILSALATVTIAFFRDSPNGGSK